MASNPDTITRYTIKFLINYRTDKYGPSSSEAMIQTIHETTASEVKRKLNQAFEGIVNVHKPHAEAPITNSNGYRGTALIKYKVKIAGSIPLENDPHQHRIPVCLKIRHSSKSMFNLEYFKTAISEALVVYEISFVHAVETLPLSERLASLSLFRPIQANQGRSLSPVPRPSAPTPEQWQWNPPEDGAQTRTRKPVERKMAPRPSTPTPEQWQWTPPEDSAGPQLRMPTP